MGAESSTTQFVAKAAFLSYLILWMLWHMWRTSRANSFLLNGIKRIRTVFTAFLLLGVGMQVGLYAIETYIGHFAIYVSTNAVQPPPLQKQFADYCESVEMSFLVGSLFTLQLFWHELVQRATKNQFVQTWEYKIYVTACFICFPLFPVLRIFLREDQLLREHVPQIIFGFIALIISLLGIRVYFRLRNTIRQGTLSRRNRTKKKFDYFIDLNSLFTISLFIFSISSLIFHLDSIRSEPMIMSTKFAADIILVHLNFSCIVWYVASFLVIYPYVIVMSAPNQLISAPATPIESQDDNFSPLTNDEIPKLGEPTLPPTPPYSLSGKRRITVTLVQSSSVSSDMTMEKPGDFPHEIKTNLHPPPRPRRQNTITRSQQSPQPLIGEESSLADDRSFVLSEAGEQTTSTVDASVAVEIERRKTPSFITGFDVRDIS